MREGGRSGGVPLLFGSEGGCLLVSMRLVVLRMHEEENYWRSNFSCEIPRAAAEVDEARGEELCSLGVLHLDHSRIVKGLLQAIREETDFRNNRIIGFEQCQPRAIAPIFIVSVFEKQKVP